MLSRLRLQLFVAAVGFLAIGLSLAYFLLLIPRQSEPARGGTYVEGLVLDGSPDLLLNPLFQANDTSRDISSLIFSGLTRNAPDGTVKGEISDGWDFLDGGKTWEFHLRTSARWQDGVPITARDVVFTVKILKNPEFPRLFPSARALADIWQDIEVDRIGDYTVRFRLTKGLWTPFLNYTSFGLLPQHILDKVNLSDFRNSDFNKSPVGSGPYRLAQNGIARDGVTLVSNQYYYGQQPYIGKIWFRYYPSARAALDALDTRQVDGVSSVPPEEKSRVDNNKKVQELSAPVAATTFLFLNLDRTERFGQKEVRQAIAYAINRKAIVDEEFAGQGGVSNSPMLAFQWAYKKDITAYDYNPGKARDLLEKAGWRLNAERVRSKDGQPLVFSLLIGSPDSQPIADRITANLREIGIVAQVRVSASPQDLQSDLDNHRYDALLLSTKAVINDPDVYQIWASGRSFNYSNWKNDQADRLLEQARQSLVQDDRKKLYDQWQDIFADELPAIPLYYVNYTWAVADKVQGLKPGELQVVNEFSDRLKDITSRYVITDIKFGS